MRRPFRTLDYTEGWPISPAEPLAEVVMALVPPASHVDPFLAAPRLAHRSVARARIRMLLLILLAAWAAYVAWRWALLTSNV
jgi:hypothetical protein